MKRLTLLITISVFNQAGFAETMPQPDYQKIIVKGMVEGMKAPFANMPRTIKLFNDEITGSSKKWKKTVTCKENGKKCKTTYSD